MCPFRPSSVSLSTYRSPVDARFDLMVVTTGKGKEDKGRHHLREEGNLSRRSVEAGRDGVGGGGWGTEIPPTTSFTGRVDRVAFVHWT